MSLCIAECREGGLHKGEEDERPPSGRLYNSVPLGEYEGAIK